MAACTDVARQICRSVFLVHSTLKCRNTHLARQQFAQIHFSLPFCGRKPLRRKALQVILPDGTDSAATGGTHSVRQPRSRSSRLDGFPNEVTAKDRTSHSATHNSDTSFPPISDTSFLKPKDRNHLFSQEGVEDADTKFTYQKLSAVDKRFGTAMTMSKNRKLRERKNKVILEGKRLIGDALSVGATCHTIFFSAVSNLDGLPINKMETELVKLPYKEFETWSNLSTPQGIVGVFSKPTSEMVQSDHLSDPCMPLTLICDNIRDPGNLGTILRAAAASNCEKILVTKGCVDIWEPKVLRAGVGAHFHTAITNRVSWREVANYLDPETSLYVADAFSQTDESDESLPQLPYSDLDWATQSALVIGGETEGVSPEAFELCQRTHGTKVYIRMSNSVDSLNAAMSASIILFEAKRQWLLQQKKC